MYARIYFIDDLKINEVSGNSPVNSVNSALNSSIPSNNLKIDEVPGSTPVNSVNSALNSSIPSNNLKIDEISERMKAKNMRPEREKAIIMEISVTFGGLVKGEGIGSFDGDQGKFGTI
ncbi:uncharacterized protein A4U43_C07F23520 [Asparagus officinalis]|uniref:Uncharacterized protein n=1 Tax=Asparagus officinalis TaxID=4686 RepID=A0A5P1EEH4_ASPOF|nr:uncharacterized protein A4U43_C07F23520 [Asparagus officinalis]